MWVQFIIPIHYNSEFIASSLCSVHYDQWIHSLKIQWNYLMYKNTFYGSDKLMIFFQPASE
jgi:hypothetical protein